MRTIQHTEGKSDQFYVEVLDHEESEELLEHSRSFTGGIRSCRHVQLHIGKDQCVTLLDVCL